MPIQICNPSMAFTCSSLIGPWKRKCLAEFGIITQCVAPTRVNDQYITNVLLKINAKVCGFHILPYLALYHFISGLVSTNIFACLLISLVA